MKKNKIKKPSETQHSIKEMLKYVGVGIKDKYIIDDKNAIIVVEKKGTNFYEMIHKRLVGIRLVEVNRWTLPSYYFGGDHELSIVRDYDLFLVPNHEWDGSLYNYKKDCFVLPQGEFDIVRAGTNLNHEYIERYNGFLASFEIGADYQDGDVFSYINPVTKERITIGLGVPDEKYFAIINPDGSIRSNRLFKGNSFSKIEKIIDLSKYESLDAFKEERRAYCNKKMEENRKAYHDKIAAREDKNDISPYLDYEVLKILNLKSE